MKLSEKIYTCAEKFWPLCLEHPFVQEMAKGTLPPEKFKYYMLQDYAYLRDYVKIFAVILPKSDSFEEIRFLSEQLHDTIGETYRTHLPYMKRLGITEEEAQAVVPQIDNRAYTHYMICEAQAGDVLTGLVSLLNCSWGYAYVAEETVRRFPEALRHPLYGEWFAGYVSEAYQKTNQDLIGRIDLLAEGISEDRTKQLCEIFQNCCLLDLRFWDMAYHMGQNTPSPR